MSSRPDGVSFASFAAALVLAFAAGCASTSTETEPRESDERLEAPQPPDPAEELESLRREASLAYRQRGEEGEVDRAIELWHRVLDHEAAGEWTDHQRAEIFVSIARAHYFVARFRRADGPVVDRDSDLGDRVADGRDAAGRAVELLAPEFYRAVRAGAPFEAQLPEAPPEATRALLWYAQHLDLEARTGNESTEVALRPVVDTIMEHVADHRPEAYFGAAHRYFGVQYVDRLFDRDLEASAEAFARSRDIAPHFLLTALLEAHHLAVDRGDREAFESRLRAVTGASEDALPEAEPENRIVRRWAVELLDEADEFFGDAPAAPSDDR